MHTPRIFNNWKYLSFFINFFQSYINTATLNLLTSSILVSISGAFRVYIASLLLGTHVTPLVCIAGGLVIYSVYTLDRALDSEEDLINRKEFCGSCKEMGFAASILSITVGGYILLRDGLLWLVFVPIVTGFLYSKGIKIGSRSLRLKGGLGVKNLVVGISWGVFITGLACTTCKHIIYIIVIFILYGVKVFVNSAIDDFKDVKGDTIAGIQTLPVRLGEVRTRYLLLGLHLLSHLILGFAIIKEVITFAPFILICSFLCGLICIFRYTNEVNYFSRKYEMSVFKEGESSIISVLSVILPLFTI